MFLWSTFTFRNNLREPEFELSLENNPITGIAISKLVIVYNCKI